MDDNYAQSLVAWANTFNYSTPTSSFAEAKTISDFSSGDLLIPIARTITAGPDQTYGEGYDESSSGWAGVFFHMKPAGLIASDAEVPEQKNGAKMIALAVTCLESLVRYTVGEHCSGRDNFIRQILTLDVEAQSILSQIIIGQRQQQYSGAGSEAGSPSRESTLGGAANFAGLSPVASPLMITSPAGLRANGAGSSPGDGTSCFDERSFKSWFSPQSSEKSLGLAVAGHINNSMEKGAAPVGPRKLIQGLNLDMETGTGLERATRNPVSASSLPTTWSDPTATAVDAEVRVSNMFTSRA